MINLEKKKFDDSYNQIQSSSNLSPTINPSTTCKVSTIVSDTSNVLSLENCFNYPLQTNFLNENTPSSVLNTSLDKSTEKNVQLINIKDKIRSWIINYKVSHNCANSLLKIIKSEGLNVPSDVRTLMQTPVTHKIIDMDNGSYIHFGIEKMLFPIFQKYLNKLNSNNIFKIGVNIDGLPISKSSKSQLWPILISIINCNVLCNYVIPIGIFHGFTKPICVNKYFNPFLLDISVLLDSGLSVNNVVFKFEIGHIVCDSPAKAFLLNVKGHNAYFGCSSCMQEGIYIQNRMTYPDIDAPLRTNESFRSRLNEEYHKGDTPLELLPIDVVNDVCLDYMHNICLGITKRLIEFWVKGSKNVRLSEANKKKITIDLLNLRNWVPSEFSRLPRAIEDIEYWKATELRAFLLYFGPIVLKGKLNKNFFSHFMLLVCGVRILISSYTCQTLNDLALSLFKQFINLYSVFYGEHYISYNVHSLIHLPMFVQSHGPLDNFSCFKYENFLQEIKKFVKCAKYPLQEIFNRILEKQTVFISNPLNEYNFMLLKEMENIIPSRYYKLTDTLFEQIILHDLKITINILKEKDKFICLKDNTIVAVNHIIKNNTDDIKLIVYKFLSVSELFTSPISSLTIDTHIVDTNFISDSFSVPISDVKFKCFVVRISSNKAIITALHHSLHEQTK